MLKIGVIADDFTGATDIASFLVENGMPTVQINDVPTGTQPEGCDAVVISLKTRSCPAQEAIKQSLAALVWLKKQGCQQVYFKYCSTFEYRRRQYRPGHRCADGGAGYLIYRDFSRAAG